MPRKKITPATGYYQGFEILGLDEIERKLQGLEERVRRKYVRKALKKGAEHIRAEAARRVRKAPTPTRPDKGHIADAIVTKVWIKKERANATVGVNWPTHSYGHLLEYPRPLPGGGQSKSYPFMRPAFEGKKEKSLDEILTQLRDAILKEAGNGS